MIIVVTGTRYARYDDHLNEVVAVLQTLIPPNYAEPITLRHGAEQWGLDALAARIAVGWGWTVEPFEAKWAQCGPVGERHEAGCPPHQHRRQRADGSEYCPMAGPRRNRLMVEAEPVADAAAAFPARGDWGRGGTWDCMTRLAEAGVWTVVHSLVVTRSSGGRRHSAAIH